jgi:hypothetical protein
MKSLIESKSNFVRANILLAKRRNNEFAREASKQGILDCFPEYHQGIELMKKQITGESVKISTKKRWAKLEGKKRSEYVHKFKKQDPVPKFESRLS